MENSHNLTVMGDLNCGKVQWEDWYTEGSEDSWGNKLLNLTMENALTLWVGQEITFRGDTAPSKLELIFTKRTNTIENLTYTCPVGKSDHVVRT